MKVPTKEVDGRRDATAWSRRSHDEETNPNRTASEPTNKPGRNLGRFGHQEADARRIPEEFQPEASHSSATGRAAIAVSRKTQMGSLAMSRDASRTVPFAPPSEACRDDKKEECADDDAGANCARWSRSRFARHQTRRIVPAIKWRRPGGCERRIVSRRNESQGGEPRLDKLR